jgi:hypothetical protein
MRNTAWLAVSALAALALAGCAGGSDDGSSNSGNNGGSGTTYSVKVNGAHALQTKTRTIKVDLMEGGANIGSGTFTVNPDMSEEPKLVFERTVKGPVTARAFEGSNPVGTKTLNPANCPEPLEFEIHVVDDAVHMYSNCD